MPDAPRQVGDLAQHGCSMSGFAFHLAALDAGLAVVIFGERDCANAFPRSGSDFLARSPWHVYTTALRERDVMAGAAEERLAACLRAVAREARPRGIVVLSTCLTEMIGADPVPVARAAAAETGLPVVAVRTSGLRLRTQADVADHAAATLAEVLGEPGPAAPDAVDLVGFPTRRSWASARSRPLCTEVAGVLKRAGLRLGAAVPTDASARDWAALGRATTLAVVEAALYPRLLAALAARAGREGGVVPTVREVPSPLGLQATDRFYRTLLAGAADADALLDRLPARRAAAAEVRRTRERFQGLRLAYGIGSHHNFEASGLAGEGLGDLARFLELGFEVEVVIQERDRPEVHDRIRRTLAAVGVDLPYRLFYEPGVLAPALAEGRYDAAVLSDFLGGQADRARVPWVALGTFPAGYAGTVEACRRLVEALPARPGGRP